METTAAPLPDLSRFFDECWRLFRARVWKLLTIGGCGSMAAVAVGALPLGAGFALALASSLSPVLIWTVAGAASLSAMLWIISWAQAAMLECALAEEAQAGIWDCCRRAWPKTASFSWVCVLYVLLTIGGFCVLALPGMYLSLTLLLAPMVCVAESAAGRESLKRSLQLTEGRFPIVAVRVALAGLAASLPGFVPFVGWLLGALASPFSLVALAVLYKQLRQARPQGGPPARMNWVLGLAAAGLLVPVGIGLAAAPTVIARAPQLIEQAKRLAQSPPDPAQLQKLLDALQGGGSTTEEVSAVVGLAAGSPPAAAVSASTSTPTR